MNDLPHGKRALLKRLLAHGASHRAIALAVPCGLETVAHYANMWMFNPICPCGKPSGHRGWCPVRRAYSLCQSGHLADKWKKRGDSTLLTVIAEARMAAAANGHTLGPFIWSAGETASAAYAVCAVCGKQVRIWFDEHSWRDERYDATAIANPCETPEQVAADKAAHEERRKWHEGRKKLAEVRKLLRRQSHSPNGASTQEPSSRR